MVKVAHFKIEFKGFLSHHWELFCVILLLGAGKTDYSEVEVNKYINKWLSSSLAKKRKLSNYYTVR